MSPCARGARAGRCRGSPGARHGLTFMLVMDGPELGPCMQGICSRASATRDGNAGSHSRRGAVPRRRGGIRGRAEHHRGLPHQPVRRPNWWRGTPRPTTTGVLARTRPCSRCRARGRRVPRRFTRARLLSFVRARPAGGPDAAPCSMESSTASSPPSSTAVDDSAVQGRPAPSSGWDLDAAPGGERSSATRRAAAGRAVVLRKRSRTSPRR